MAPRGNGSHDWLDVALAEVMGHDIACGLIEKTRPTGVAAFQSPQLPAAMAEARCRLPCCRRISLQGEQFRLRLSC